MELFGTQVDPDRLLAPWRWWQDRFADCLATRARGSGPRLALLRDGRVEWAGEHYADIHRFLQGGGFGREQRRRGLTAVLPADDLLVMPLALPLAAAQNLGDVLRYEMDRYTPFAAADVYFDQRILGRDAKRERVDVELALVRRDRVDPALQALEARGVRVRALRGEGLWDGADLLPAGRRSRPRLGGADTRWVLGALVLVLAAAVLATPLLQARAAVVATGAELAELRAKVEGVLALRRRLEARSELVEAVRSHGGGRPAAVEVLAELTRLLPDDTWLQNFELKQDRVEIQGESARATDLIALLEASELFSDVAFRAPLMPVRGKDKERFAIVMQAGRAP